MTNKNTLSQITLDKKQTPTKTYKAYKGHGTKLRKLYLNKMKQTNKLIKKYKTTQQTKTKSKQTRTPHTNKSHVNKN